MFFRLSADNTEKLINEKDIAILKVKNELVFGINFPNISNVSYHVNENDGFDINELFELVLDLINQAQKNNESIVDLTKQNLLFKLKEKD